MPAHSAPDATSTGPTHPTPTTPGAERHRYTSLSTLMSPTSPSPSSPSPALPRSSPSSVSRASGLGRGGVPGPAPAKATPRRLALAQTQGKQGDQGGASSAEPSPSPSPGSPILVRSKHLAAQSPSHSRNTSIGNAPPGEWLSSVREEGHVRRDSQCRDRPFPERAGEGGGDWRGVVFPGDAKGKKGGGVRVSRQANGMGAGKGLDKGKKDGKGKGDGRMGLGRMMALTVSMGGSQVSCQSGSFALRVTDLGWCV